MRNLLFSALVMLSAQVSAAGSETKLNVAQYLEQVRTQNRQASSLIQSIQVLENRLEEPGAMLVPEFYAQAGLFDDKKQAANPAFAGVETQGSTWRTGFRKQTEFGLGANLYFNSQRAKVSQASPMFLPVPDFAESALVLELNQPLWRNAFGDGTRANIEMARESISAGLYEAKFQLKNFMLNAQNLYWSVVSYNQIIQLQEDNVARAKKLRDRMTRGSKLRLFDDTDAMQAEAAYQLRDLELQSSIDERAEMIRQFNTLRGSSQDTIEPLDDFPVEALAKEVTIEQKGKISREDFSMLKAQARAAKASAMASRSKIRPQLDLQMSVAGTGRDGTSSKSYSQATSDEFPTWSVGVVFSVPLDFGLTWQLRRAYHASGEVAQAQLDHAEYSEQRTWADLVKQQREAHGRFKRAMEIEKIQTNLVQRERKQLANGRSTTFEALNIEQGLALAQIQRVRSQLVFLQIHNLIKTFEVQ